MNEESYSGLGFRTQRNKSSLRAETSYCSPEESLSTQSRSDIKNNDNESTSISENRNRNNKIINNKQTESPANPNLISEDLMSQYMQQCLEYHNQQLLLENEATNTTDHQYSYPQQESLTFIQSKSSTIPASDTFLEYKSHEGNNNTFSRVDKVCHTTSDNIEGGISSTLSSSTIQHIIPDDIAPQNDSCTEQNIKLKQALDKAKSIVDKFNCTNNNNNIEDITNTQQAPSSSNLTSKVAYPFAQKRNDYISTVYSNKLRNYFIKNLSYLAQKDEQIHEQQLLHLQQYNKNINIQKSNSINLNKIKSISGIGTKERKNVEKFKIQKGHSLGRTHDSHTLLGVYITGLTTYHEQQQQNDYYEYMEGLLRQLFESYGKVRKITFYMNKSTGLYKGDGLILFSSVDYEKYNTKESFIHEVCSQFNGAELPCGSVLSVVPADMNYCTSNKSKIGKEESTEAPVNDNHNYYGDNKKNLNLLLGNQKQNSNSGNVLDKKSQTVPDTVSNKCVENNDNGVEEDLDDFFASLE